MKIHSTDFGRLIKIDEKIGAENFSTQYEYDNFGNQTKVIYPSGFVVKNVFNSIGEMYKITDNTESITIWQRTATNEYGNYTEYTTGNGKTTKKEYDIYGLPKRFSAVGVYDIQMNFNAETGNLTSRKDNLLNLTENFTYDNLNRLTSSQVVGQAIMNISYANNGNIQSKSDVGNYSYDQNKVNAVAKITPPLASDLNSSVISQQDQLIEYTSFSKAKKLTENGYELTISYGVDEMRRKGEMKQNGVVIQTRYYLPRYEKTIEGTSTIEVNYISTPDGVIAMYVQENGAGNYHYVYRDHLRTPLVVTSSTGVIEYKQSYDAWGKSRNPNNWTYDMSSYTVTRPTWMYRGFTGHEHLPQFTLINMNGRMYDPITGRMLSVDDFIQVGDYSQSYNRYSYVWNNPLRYMDPTGYITWWDVGAGAAIVGGAVMVATGFGAGAGAMLIAGGFGHFANSTNNYYANKDNGGTWNQASTQAGITFSYTATVNMSGIGNTPQLNQQKVRESDQILIGVGYSPPVAANYNGLNEYASIGDDLWDLTVNYLGNVGTAAEMTLDWALGTGPENRKFVNDKVAKAFMNATRVNEARDFYYNKYSDAKSLVNTSVVGFKGSFGATGLWDAGLDPIEQFVGTYRINIYNMSGETLWFVLTNQTSMNSFLYDAGPSWQRSTWSPGGNTTQMYIWSEPVRK